MFQSAKPCARKISGQKSNKEIELTLQYHSVIEDILILMNICNLKKLLDLEDIEQCVAKISCKIHQVAEMQHSVVLDQRVEKMDQPIHSQTFAKVDKESERETAESQHFASSMNEVCKSEVL